MNRILLTAIFTFSILIFSTGCTITPKYRVSIDAITAENISIAPSSYVIKALDDKKDTHTLIFQQHSQKLAQVLQQKGYVATQGAVATQTIYFDYGIEKVNEETQTYSEPDISFHIGYGYGHRGYYSPFYFNPFYGSFYGTGFGGGYNTYSKTRIYYNRYVILLAKDQSNKELWRVDVSSVGESKNLKKIIPLLLEASTPYIGTNTDEPIQLVIKDKPKKR